MLFWTYVSICLITLSTFQASEASILSSLFWGGFVTGRLAAIVISKYFNPSTIILADFVGIACNMVTIYLPFKILISFENASGIYRIIIVSIRVRCTWLTTSLTTSYRACRAGINSLPLRAVLVLFQISCVILFRSSWSFGESIRRMWHELVQLYLGLACLVSSQVVRKHYVS